MLPKYGATEWLGATGTRVSLHHYRRDVSFREDACGVSQRGAAQMLATLRNLDLGLHELAVEREEIAVPSAGAGCRQRSFSRALAWLRR